MTTPTPHYNKTRQPMDPMCTDPDQNPFLLSSKNAKVSVKSSIQMTAHRGIDKSAVKHFTTTNHTLSAAKPNTLHLLPNVQPLDLSVERGANSKRNSKVSVMALNHKLLSKGAQLIH